MLPFSIEIHKAQLLLASQEQASAATTNTPTPAASAAAAASATALASTLPQPSVSQSNIQTQMQAANLASAVANSVHLQQLQKQATPHANGQTAAMPYGFATYPTAGLQYANPNGFPTAYDPKTMLMASANKLKMLPTPAGIKLDQRYTPY